MEFIKGQRIILNGRAGQLRHVMHYLPIRFFHEGKRILIVDTINSINPHHPFFNNEFQKEYFKNILCVRTPLPYDLWARLATTGNFIKKRKINVLLISSLSLIFRDCPNHEIEPMLRNILKRVDYLTSKYELITVLGNSPSEDESARFAYDILTQEKIVRGLNF